MICNPIIYQCILLQAILVFAVRAANNTPWESSYFGTISAADQVNGSAKIDTSPFTALAAPKFLTVNGSDWDEWYFDSVTYDGTQGVDILFARDASLTRFEIPIIRVSLDAVWENGTTFTTMLFATNSSVENRGSSIHGLWAGEDWTASFIIAQDNSNAVITFDSSIIKGTYHLESFTTPRYATNGPFPNNRGEVEFAPLIYWNSPTPGGRVSADFIINGTAFQQNGMIGGFDRNWAPFAYDYFAQEWWWSRVVTGPYAATFWILTSAVDNQTYVSAFVEKDHTVVFESIESSEISFVLNYNGSVHGQFEDLSTGWTIDLTPPSGPAYSFTINHTSIWFEADRFSSNNEYSRFTNVAYGGTVGEEIFHGAAINEQGHIIDNWAIPPAN